MAKLPLRYVTLDRDRYGNLRIYFRRPGKPKIRLRGDIGSEEFMRAYQAALKESSQAAFNAEKSLDWVCDRYLRSVTFQSFEESTKRRKRAVLEEICDITTGEGKRIGTFPYESMSSASVRKIRDMKKDKPESANYRLKQLSALFSWAVTNELAKTNPVAGVEKLKSNGKGYYPWTENDLDRFESQYPIGSQERLSMSIMLYLGVRRSDAVQLGPQHESSSGESLQFTVFKGRKRHPKTLILPILPELRRILDASSIGKTAYLLTTRGEPWGSADSFGNWFRDRCRAAGLPDCSPHGLRKLGATRCAEAGASEHQLMAIFGWDTSGVAKIYTVPFMN